MTLADPVETHEKLISRIPGVTGRTVEEWINSVADGPAFVRPHERVEWLRAEYELSHGYAKAIVHEYDLRRAAARMR